VRRSLEVKLVGLEFHPVRVVHGLAGLDAEQHFLGVSVVVMQIVAIVGGDERDAGFLREPHQVGVYFLFDLKPLVLNFEKEIPFPKNIAQAISIFASLVELFLDDRFSNRTAKARGKSD
jgi:hypothetical protein